MRIRLADPGDIGSPFGPRMDVRARSLRRQDGGGGGGENDDTGEKEGEDDKDDDSGDDDDKDEDDKDDKKDSDDTEVKKAIRRRDRAIREKRALQEELQKLRDKDKDKDTPDPAEVANQRIIRAEVRTQLASAGVTDREDQKAILDILNLSGISVDDRGDPDVDEIEDRIGELRRIFGGSAKTAKRTPRVDTRDRGADKDQKTDPDSSRYQRILGRR